MFCAGTGAFDAARPTEGAYSALLTFENGAFASLTYGGYGHFDSDEFSGWIGELGQAKSPNARKPPPHFASAEEEAAFKNARNYGGSGYQPPVMQDLAHQHFGTIIVSCERADLRPLPNGVAIYEGGTARLDSLPLPRIPRREVIDELYDAVFVRPLRAMPVGRTSPAPPVARPPTSAPRRHRCGRRKCCGRSRRGPSRRTSTSA